MLHAREEQAHRALHDNSARCSLVGRKPGPPRADITISLPASLHDALRIAAARAAFAGEQSRVVEEAVAAFIERMKAGRPCLLIPPAPENWIKNTYRIDPEVKRRLQEISEAGGKMFTLQNIIYSALSAYLLGPKA